MAIFLLLGQKKKECGHIFIFSMYCAVGDNFNLLSRCVIRARYDQRTDLEACRVTSRPSLISVYLNVVLYAATGLTMSSLTWTKASKELWKRFFRKYVTIKMSASW